MLENYKVGKNAIVNNSEIGTGTTLWNNVNIYGSKIGKNCVIGSFTEIGGSIIGDNCKVEAFAFIPPGITIGNNVFIGPRVSFANDKYPKAGGEWKQSKTFVEDDVSIGIASTILPGVRLGKGCMIGGGAVVTKDVAPGEIVVGVPARPLQAKTKDDKVKMASPKIDSDTEQEVLKVLRSGDWAQGKKVQEFESEFAKFIGVKHTIAVSSGTTALHAALLSVGVGSGDEVITAPFSFVASTNSILMCGAKPVFVDIDAKTYCIATSKIEKAITPKTKAILVVHLYGQACDMTALKAICSKHKLLLVEDACQAHGAEFSGKRAGSFGDVGCFSFYATKNVACGEGGMITTNDDEVADKLKLLRAHGEAQRYSSVMLGYNYRLTEVAAAIGIGQLKLVEEGNKKRWENAALLTSLLKEVKGIVTPFVDPRGVPAFHQYTIRITKDYKLTRAELVALLDKAGIESKVFYPNPLNKMTHISSVTGITSCPVTEKACEEVLSLPIHPGVSESEIKRIAEVIRNA